MILNYCGVRGQKAVDFLADVLGDSVLSLGEARERGIRKLFSANAYILTVPLYGGLSCTVLDDIKSTVFCGSKITRNDSDEAERRERSPPGVVSAANDERLAGAARQVRGASPAREWKCFASQREFRGERGGPDGRSCTPQAGRRVKAVCRAVPSAGSPFTRSQITAKIKLHAWAMTVARAAPAASSPRRPTNTRSSTTLTRQAMKTKRKGERELPMPRKMPLMPL